jgi:hypothetical protein
MKESVPGGQSEAMIAGWKRRREIEQSIAFAIFL